MKRFFIIALVLGISETIYAQDASQQDIRNIDRSQIQFLGDQSGKQYKTEFDVGGRLNTDGWNIYFELEKRKNQKLRTLYQFELGETKHPKEDKNSHRGQYTDGWGYPHSTSGRPFIYGKRNVFYQLRLGYGQRRVIGNKGNKNGVEVSAIYMAGVSVGLVKPYYLELVDSTGNSYYDTKYIPGPDGNRDNFLNPVNIVEGGGFSKGWDEVVVNPGLYARLGMRFDWAEYNDFVSALEVGVTGSYYAKEVQIMIDNKASKFFYGAYVSILFGKRW